MELKRILVVDDEPILRKMLLKIIKKTTHEGFEAENGQIALEMYAREPFDLLILDLRMPVMGGRDFLKAAKERNWNPNVIMLTGHGELTEAYELLRLYRIHDFIQKPLNNPFQLIFGINNALEKRRIEDELLETNRQLSGEIERRSQAEADLAAKNKQIAQLLKEADSLNAFVSQKNQQLETSKKKLVETNQSMLHERRALAEEMQRSKTSLSDLYEACQLKTQWFKRFLHFDPVRLAKGNPVELDQALLLWNELRRFCDLELAHETPQVQVLEQRDLLGRCDSRAESFGVTVEEPHGIENLPEQMELNVKGWDFILDQALRFGLYRSDSDVTGKLRIVEGSADHICWLVTFVQSDADQQGQTIHVNSDGLLFLEMARTMARELGGRMSWNDAVAPSLIHIWLPFKKPVRDLSAMVLSDDPPVSQAVPEASPTLLIFDSDVLRAFTVAKHLGEHDWDLRIADQLALVHDQLRKLPKPIALLWFFNAADPHQSEMQSQVAAACPQSLPILAIGWKGKDITSHQWHGPPLAKETRTKVSLDLSHMMKQKAGASC
jgi:DNA-binding response OmpR family regulator